MTWYSLITCSLHDSPRNLFRNQLHLVTIGAARWRLQDSPPALAARRLYTILRGTGSGSGSDGSTESIPWIPKLLVLAHHYWIVTDCGKALSHSAIRGNGYKKKRWDVETHIQTYIHPHSASCAFFTRIKHFTSENSNDQTRGPRWILTIVKSNSSTKNWVRLNWMDKEK